jgi:uncharacterized membrane protein
MAATAHSVTHRSSTRPDRQERFVNVSKPERAASGAVGAALAFYGLKHGGWSGLLLALAGGALAYRGATGHCDVYGALGINTASGKGRNASVQHGPGIKIEKSVTINQSPAELYQFWRNFENLPRFMNHLASVRALDDKRSHWVATAPAGTTVEWDAEIINEEQNELIAWRSLAEAQVANAGSVRFEQAPNGRGTVVKVTLSYEPPGGALGSWLAKLFGEEPGQQIAEDPRRFKQIMEAGETPSIEGQPSGRNATSGSHR